MVNLTGHEAGNGGYRQGTPTTRRAFLYSDPNSAPSADFLQRRQQFFIIRRLV